MTQMDNQGETRNDRWQSPLVKKGALKPIMGETTPFIFKGRLYRLENWQKFMELPRGTCGDRYLEDVVRIWDVAADRLVSVALTGHSFGMAFVWEDRVYVYSAAHPANNQWRTVTEITLTTSDDLIAWTTPETVLRAQPGEHLFNVAVCRGPDRFIMLYETNDRRWPAFTFKYCESTDLRNWKLIPEAVYGVDKYVGGPALYFEGGRYYTLYLQDLGGTWETRITRSTDLIRWEDAPLDRPFLPFDPDRSFEYWHQGELRNVREINASDAEVCAWQGKTLVYFNGGDQQSAGDLQLAEFDGPPRRLFEAFFETAPDAVNVADYLARHDVVYQSPPLNGWEGFPLGNGSLGGPLWATPDGVIFQTNHTDAYELPDPEAQDEGWAVLRSCGRLTIRHAVPCHDWLSLNDFAGRLSLGEATAQFKARTAFGAFETTAYVHARRPVAVFEHQAAYSEAVGPAGAPIRIGLERWGSRVFGWWYGGIQGGAGIGLGDVRATTEGGDLCLRAAFRGVEVALRCRVAGAPATARVVHAHQAEIEVAAAPAQRFRVLLACVTSHDDPDPAAAARRALDAAMAETDLPQSHRQWWRAYWNRSFLQVGDDYYENLYYLHLYLMGASAQGKYPPLFNGGLWLWNRDVRNWVNPHHWNQQMAHWCLPAANRSDLLQPYLDTYHRLMPHGLAAAQRRGFSGLIWNEMHDFAGRQLGETSANMKDNFTPAPQIAMFFWWHYRFSGDTARLRDQGYPYLKAVGDFYLGWVQWEPAEGRYALPAACTYEEYDRLEPGKIPVFADSITNLAMIRAVCGALLEASQALGVDADLRSRWQHLLAHLPPYRLNDRDASRGVTLASGLLEGRELPAKENHNHGPLFCPVFPAGDLGLKDRGTALYDAARHTLATYPAAANCITPTVAVAARLGMAEEAHRRLDVMVRNLQLFPNGLFFNLDWWFSHSRHCPVTLPDWKGDLAGLPYQRDYVEDGGCRFRNVHVTACEREGVPAHRTDTPTWPFTQPGLESLGHFAAGLQEMLLQSHEGVIRVFPAVPEAWETAFTLLAEGGFTVSARRTGGQPPDFVVIVSRRGGVCRVDSPWSQGAQVWSGGNPCAARVAGTCVVFDTQPGQEFILGPAGKACPHPCFEIGHLTNREPKRYHEATLGKARDY